MVDSVDNVGMMHSMPPVNRTTRFGRGPDDVGLVVEIDDGKAPEYCLHSRDLLL